MRQSRFILTVLPLLLVSLGAGTVVEAQGLSAGNESNSQNEILTIRERASGVSLSDYIGCINFCQLKLPDTALQRVCIEGCRQIDSSFQGEGAFLGLVPTQ